MSDNCFLLLLGVIGFGILLNIDYRIAVGVALVSYAIFASK